eukprot:COSAG04_NODE_63_length_30038_cov_9.461071_2_plen_434_part_00
MNSLLAQVLVLPFQFDSEGVLIPRFGLRCDASVSIGQHSSFATQRWTRLEHIRHGRAPQRNGACRLGRYVFARVGLVVLDVRALATYLQSERHRGLADATAEGASRTSSTKKRRWKPVKSPCFQSQPLNAWPRFVRRCNTSASEIGTLSTRRLRVSNKNTEGGRCRARPVRPSCQAKGLPVVLFAVRHTACAHRGQVSLVLKGNAKRNRRTERNTQESPRLDERAPRLRRAGATVHQMFPGTTRARVSMSSKCHRAFLWVSTHTTEMEALRLRRSSLPGRGACATPHSPAPERSIVRCRSDSGPTGASSTLPPVVASKNRLHGEHSTAWASGLSARRRWKRASGAKSAYLATSSSYASSPTAPPSSSVLRPRPRGCGLGGGPAEACSAAGGRAGRGEKMPSALSESSSGDAGRSPIAATTTGRSVWPPAAEGT